LCITESMRAKRAVFDVMAFQCCASFGEISRSMACSASLVWALARFQKTAETRSSVRPAFSRAAMVFSKVGAAGLLAMRSISARCSARACSKAGWKCSGLISEKGGTPKGVDQGASKGFAAELALMGWKPQGKLERMAKP